MYISIESCLGFQDNRYSKNERNKVHKQLTTKKSSMNSAEDIFI